ncbi:MAG TPA: hypothetical protein VF843_09090 [Streptosporangiaceae bacterium]
MFVSERARLPISFATAQVRLANAVAAGNLLAAARQAYDEHGRGIDEHGAALIRVGPLAGLPGGSRLVRVHFRDLAVRGEQAVLALRWEAAGPGGGLFPALDADITLAPDGADGAIMALDGAYRPPLGHVGAGLDRALLHHAATATVRRFLALLAESIVAPAPSPAAGPAPAPGEQLSPWLPPAPEPG